MNIPHWQMAHAQGMTSPVAGWGVGGCPRVSASPRPTPQLLALGPGLWVSLSGLGGGLSDQPVKSKPCGPSIDIPLPTPHALRTPPPSSHSVPPHPSTSLFFPFTLTNLCSHPGKESDLVGYGPPSHSMFLCPSGRSTVSVNPVASCWPLGGSHLGLGTGLSGEPSGSPPPPTWWSPSPEASLTVHAWSGSLR